VSNRYWRQMEAEGVDEKGHVAATAIMGFMQKAVNTKIAAKYPGDVEYIHPGPPHTMKPTLTNVEARGFFMVAKKQTKHAACKINPIDIEIANNVVAENDV
jgi:hypothetical protein